MRAQQAAVRDEEGVLRVAGGMIVGEIEQREVVAVVLDLRAFGDAVAERPEDRFDLARDQGDRVERAGRRPPPGQGDVDARRPQARLLLGRAELGVARCERRLDAQLAGR